MSEFVYLFRSTDEGRRAAMGTPEAAQRSLQGYLAWIAELEANGLMKNRGLPLDPNGRVVTGPGPEPAITDGPYVEVKDMVLGFIVVQARDLAEAVAWAARCPIALGGGSVEVRPVMPMAL